MQHLNELAAIGSKHHDRAEAYAIEVLINKSATKDEYIQRSNLEEPDLKVIEWLETYVEEVWHSEVKLLHDRTATPFAGTADLVVRLKDGSIALCDYKFRKWGGTILKPQPRGCITLKDALQMLSLIHI